jgi:hypothetical protein
VTRRSFDRHREKEDGVQHLERQPFWPAMPQSQPRDMFILDRAESAAPISHLESRSVELACHCKRGDVQTRVDLGTRCIVKRYIVTSAERITIHKSRSSPVSNAD